MQLRSLHLSQRPLVARALLSKAERSYSSSAAQHYRRSWRCVKRAALRCSAEPLPSPGASSQGSTSPEKLELAQQAAPSSTFAELLPQVLAFSLPVLLIPLADPIMSLIDTICIGRMTASTVQLAALGPCSLIFNFAGYIWNALSIATVTLVAQRLKEDDPRAASLSLSCSLAIAVAGGLAVCGVLQLWGPRLLAATGAEAAVQAPALTYLRIRALAAPAAILVQVAQAGLLGQRDSISPFQVVLATSIVSLLGDLVFIGQLGMGLAGAAWTTVLSQYMGVALLLRALQRSRVAVAAQLPGRRELAALLDTFGLLTVFYACKCTSYLWLQRTATRLTALLLAAHQPIWSIWNLMAFTNTPLEQAALAFLPSARSPQEQRQLAVLLIALGAASGVVGAVVATGLPALCPQLFTADAALWPHMKSVGLQGVLALLFCGLDVAATGVLLALKDTAYVAQAMAVSMSTLGGFLWWSRQGTVSLHTVWWGLVVFFGLRAAQSFPRALLKYVWPPAEGAAAGGAGAAVAAS